MLCPRSITVMLRYQYSGTIATGAGDTTASATFSMNSPYDPLFGVGGGKCTGFDQWTSLYKRYHVDKCRVSQVIYNPVTGPIFPFILPVRSSEAGTIAAITIDTVMENRDALCTEQMPGAHPSNGRALSNSFVPQEFEGMPGQASYDSFSGDSGNDPVIQPVLYCGFTQAAVGAASTAHIVLIEYRTTFFCPRNLGDA